MPLLLAVDVSMAGYLAGPRVGAFTYNLAHNWGTGLVVLALGLATGVAALVAAAPSSSRTPAWTASPATASSTRPRSRTRTSAGWAGGPVSPTPARTSRDAILAAARELLEDEGLDAVTMAAVADRVGVRAPSLYKHLRDRPSWSAASSPPRRASSRASWRPRSPRRPTTRPRGVRAIASAYRAFARRSPRAAALLFADLGPELPIPQAELARSARPVLEAAAALAGEDRALPAARSLTAFVHGFTSMESAGAFRLGGTVEEAYTLGIDALIRGLAPAASPDPGEADFARPS